MSSLLDEEKRDIKLMIKLLLLSLPHIVNQCFVLSFIEDFVDYCFFFKEKLNESIYLLVD